MVVVAGYDDREDCARPNDEPAEVEEIFDHDDEVD